MHYRRACIHPGVQGFKPVPPVNTNGSSGCEARRRSTPSTEPVKTLSVSLTATTGTCSLSDGIIDPNSYVSKEQRSFK